LRWPPWPSRSRSAPERRLARASGPKRVPSGSPPSRRARSSGSRFRGSGTARDAHIPRAPRSRRRARSHARRCPPNLSGRDCRPATSGLKATFL
jgi:hypothetical protein